MAKPTSPSPATPRRGGRAAIIVPAMVAVAVALAVVFGWFRSDRAPGSSNTNSGPPRTIVLITIDTLRADALGFAGNARVKTPYLDSLAADGLVFTNAHAHNTVTLPSHANILTGLLPYQHGIRDNAGYELDAKHATVARALKQQGYATAGFIGAFPLDARFGLGRDFDVYDDQYREGSRPREFVMDERSAPEVLEPATKWWSASTAEKKFLWVHLYDPHAPYSPPAPFAQEYRNEPYLGEIAFVDAQIRAFLEPILAKDPEALVIITADHGEALGDHGELTHGLFAYESTLKVPLLVYSKGRVTPAKKTRSVRHIDIAPTILAAAGIEKPKELLGHSLLEDRADADTYFEALSATMNRGWAPLVGIIHGPHKYIDLPIAELYDLPRDPAELSNLAQTDRRTLFALRKLLADAAPGAATPGDRKVSQEDQSRLLSLGYISGNAAKTSYTIEDDPKKLVDIDNDLHRVIELYQRGQIRDAVTLAQQVVKKRPGMPSAYEMLGFLLQESERPEDAIEMLRAAIADGSATEHMRARLGLTLSESGRAKEAVDVLAPIANTSDPDILNAYGIALADSGRVAEGLEQFRRVLKIDATNAKAYQNYGIVALRVGDTEDARQHLLKALELNDRLPIALNAMGVLYARERRTDDAIRAWMRAVELDPKQFDALYNVALVSGNAGRWPQAIEALDRFIRTAPPERYGPDIAKARAMREEATRRMNGTTGRR
jgi:arylsulfatase A-like enzyme/Flp pilus assembly protein TadD